MIQVDVQQAQAELPRYLELAVQGETILICRDDQPLAEIRAVAPLPKEHPPTGLAPGTVEIPPSYFDPLPDDLLAAFNGEKE